MTRTRNSSRRLAIQALYQWQLTGLAPADIEAQFRESQAPLEADAGYFAELLHGVVAHAAELDARLAPLLDRPVTQVDPVELSILRVGAFELLHRIDVPFKVVINEAVQLAKRYGAEQGHRFVNGVLDRLARETRPDERTRQARSL